jgi:hypothetical protein
MKLRLNARTSIPAVRRHRDVAVTAQEAARLIIFASHLLDIVEQRAEKPFSAVGVSVMIRSPK